eukprot:TRINITY_DN6418_c0_g1_i1.p1 TRINITY_DN6418_c0_g1~~TRINITY_DN6418_c0_g1_i1.p1  ORF type:complete len:104 (+),score=16.40 TRINITY_DN6418_c0_g1_i1:74-385(+)
MSNQMYRKSTIGEGLTAALDELVKNKSISPMLAIKILCQFDTSIQEALQGLVKSKCTFKGHLHTYRFCDNVWTFILEEATFKVDGEEHKADRVKIVARDARSS